MSDKIKIDIPATTIIKVFFIAFIFFLLFWLKEVLLLIFVSLVLAAAFQPIVKKWSGKIGKPFSVILLLLIFFSLVTGFAYLVVPPLVDQTKQLANNLPEYISRFQAFRSHFPVVERWISSISSSLTNATGSFISITAGFFGGVVSFFTVIILTLYFLLDERFFINMGHGLFPEGKIDNVINVVKKISTKVGAWLRGQIALGLIIGLISYIGLAIIGVPYAVTIAVIAGVLEIVPAVGPFIAGTLAVLIALSVSPLTALFVVIFYIIIQQLENNFLVPKIMQKAVGLPPAIIIVALLIFGKLLGIMGAILAVPILGILFVLYEERATIKAIFSK
jgi:predicted PurR-regulated permease PerM